MNNQYITYGGAVITVEDLQEKFNNLNAEQREEYGNNFDIFRSLMMTYNGGDLEVLHDTSEEERKIAAIAEILNISIEDAAEKIDCYIFYEDITIKDMILNDIRTLLDSNLKLYFDFKKYFHDMEIRYKNLKYTNTSYGVLAELDDEEY